MSEIVFNGSPISIFKAVRVIIPITVSSNDIFEAELSIAMII